MKTIKSISDKYDFSSSKYQNFSYLFEVADSKNHIKKVEVVATSVVTAESNLKYQIGCDFKIENINW